MFNMSAKFLKFIQFSSEMFADVSRNFTKARGFKKDYSNSAEKFQKSLLAEFLENSG